MTIRIRPTVAAGLCVIGLTLTIRSAAPADAARSSVAWQMDLDYLAAATERFHANPFHNVSRAQFRHEVRELRAAIPRMSRAQIVVRLSHILALVHDAHTGFGLSTSPPISFHSFPIKVYRYSDGVFVQAANPEVKGLVGKEILGVGGVPIAEVLKRIASIVPATNEWTVRSQLAFYFKGEVLHALGLSNTDTRATFELRGPEGRSWVALRAMNKPFGLGYNIGAPAKSGWDDARGTGTPPLYLRHPDLAYWYDWIADTKTMYVQCNSIANASDETFEAFFTRMFLASDALPVEKFVLDLRLNGGGDNLLLPVIVRNLVKRDRLNTRGKLFAIVGRDTQSAAENLVNRLQRDTNATFVGEPTGERPNEYGDPWPFVLPNSQIEFHVSSILWEDIDPRDDRPWTGPDIAAELSSSDYATNADPAMDRIANAKVEPVAAAIAPAVSTGDPEALSKALTAYAAVGEHKFTQFSYALEDVAQVLIDAKHEAGALAVLRWNLRRSPDSMRAKDALCDGLIAARDMASAKLCFAESLRRFPGDAVAASRLSNFRAGRIPNRD